VCTNESSKGDLKKDMDASHKDLATNKKAFFNYEILDTFEVGIQLLGTEIKSLRNNGASIQEAFITCEGGELFLVNASIQPYSFGNVYNHEEKRKRKLLAHKREIQKIAVALTEKGLTSVPSALYLKGGYAKVKIALVRGKKLFDKRKTIQERDEKRSIERHLKS
jgi:SsrA-binding protein